MSDIKNPESRPLKSGGTWLAPEFSLADVDGKTVSLAETLKSGRRVLLVFLRHLG